MLRTVKTMSDEDLAAIELAGRRCAVCRTGRRWREFVVVRPEGAAPVVMCPACRARYQDAAPAREHIHASLARSAEPAATPPAPRVAEREDRIKRALRELPRGE